MANWTHQICERCWFNGPGRTDPNTVRLPVQVIGGNEPDGIGTCHFCLEPCVSTIFTRHDPKTLECSMLHESGD